MICMSRGEGIGSSKNNNENKRRGKMERGKLKRCLVKIKNKDDRCMRGLCERLGQLAV